MGPSSINRTIWDYDSTRRGLAIGDRADGRGGEGGMIGHGVVRSMHGLREKGRIVWFTNDPPNYQANAFSINQIFIYNGYVNCNNCGGQFSGKIRKESINGSDYMTSTIIFETSIYGAIDQLRHVRCSKGASRWLRERRCTGGYGPREPWLTPAVIHAGCAAPSSCSVQRRVYIEEVGNYKSLLCTIIDLNMHR